MNKVENILTIKVSSSENFSYDMRDVVNRIQEAFKNTNLRVVIFSDNIELLKKDDLIKMLEKTVKELKK